jgi:hypothetical protein
MLQHLSRRGAIHRASAPTVDWWSLDLDGASITKFHAQDQEFNSHEQVQRQWSLIFQVTTKETGNVANYILSMPLSHLRDGSGAISRHRRLRLRLTEKRFRLAVSRPWVYAYRRHNRQRRKTLVTSINLFLLGL